MKTRHPLAPAAALAGLLAAPSPGLGQAPELTYDPSSPLYLVTHSAAVRKELKVQDGQAAKVRDVAGAGLTGAKAREKPSEILEPAQLKRLREVEVQLRGGTALVLPEVAKALDLTPARQKELGELWAAAARDVDKTLKSARFSSEKERRSYVLKAFRAAGEAMPKPLTDRQKGKLKDLQGTAVKPETLFDDPN